MVATGELRDGSEEERGRRDVLELQVRLPADPALRGVVESRLDDVLSLCREVRGGPPAAGSGPWPIRRLEIRRNGGMSLFLRVEEIDRIVAASQYSKVFAQGKTYLVREPIGYLEERLPASRFVRIHRSTIVNLDRVRGLLAESTSSRWALLEDGDRLRVSPRYWQRLRSTLITGFPRTPPG